MPPALIVFDSLSSMLLLHTLSSTCLLLFISSPRLSNLIFHFRCIASHFIPALPRYEKRKKKRRLPFFFYPSLMFLPFFKIYGRFRSCYATYAYALRYGPLTPFFFLLYTFVIPFPLRLPLYFSFHTNLRPEFFFSSTFFFSLNLFYLFIRPWFYPK